MYLHALAGQLVSTDGNGLVESAACERRRKHIQIASGRKIYHSLLVVSLYFWIHSMSDSC